MISSMFKPVETIKANLNSIPIRHGQTIYCTDSNEQFIDNIYGDRIRIGDIVTLATEEDREDILVPLYDKLYLVLENSKLYRYTGDEWICLTNTSSTTNVSLIRNTSTLNDKSPRVEINIKDFDKLNDTLIVHLNSVYLEEGIDYTIDLTSEYISPVDFDNWEADEENIAVFNFMVFKNVPCMNDMTDTINTHNEKVEKQVEGLKYENAMLLYTMMLNKINISFILTPDKLKSLYKNSLWSEAMFSKAISLGAITREDYLKLRR